MNFSPFFPRVVSGQHNQITVGMAVQEWGTAGMLSMHRMRHHWHGCTEMQQHWDALVRGHSITFKLPESLVGSAEAPV